ncbi:hypothetical protein P9112_004615 [Eukaryota sp. TZLM1-RC]
MAELDCVLHHNLEVASHNYKRSPSLFNAEAYSDALHEAGCSLEATDICSAIELHKQDLSLSKKHLMYSSASIASHRLFLCFQVLEDPIQAFTHAQFQLSYAHNSNEDHLLHSGYINLGLAHLELFHESNSLSFIDIYDSLKNFIKSLKYCNSEKELSAVSYLNIVIVLNEIGDYHNHKHLINSFFQEFDVNDPKSFQCLFPDKSTLNLFYHQVGLLLTRIRSSLALQYLLKALRLGASKNLDSSLLEYYLTTRQIDKAAKFSLDLSAFDFDDPSLKDILYLNELFISFCPQPYQSALFIYLDEKLQQSPVEDNNFYLNLVYSYLRKNKEVSLDLILKTRLCESTFTCLITFIKSSITSPIIESVIHLCSEIGESLHLDVSELLHLKLFVFQKLKKDKQQIDELKIQIQSLRSSPSCSTSSSVGSSPEIPPRKKRLRKGCF